MTYAAALARLKKITDPPGEGLTKLTKAPSGSFVSPPEATYENFSISETAPLEPQTDPPATGALWPPECLAAERKFRIPAAKLYPLLDHVVLTPAGAGILLQVFDDRVSVHLKGEPRTREFRPGQIAVVADALRSRGEKKP